MLYESHLQDERPRDHEFENPEHTQSDPESDTEFETDPMTLKLGLKVIVT